MCTKCFLFHIICKIIMSLVELSILFRRILYKILSLLNSILLLLWLLLSSSFFPGFRNLGFLSSYINFYKHIFRAERYTSTWFETNSAFIFKCKWVGEMPTYSAPTILWIMSKIIVVFTITVIVRHFKFSFYYKIWSSIFWSSF